MIKTRPLLRQPNNGKGRKAIYFTVRYQNQTAILYPNLSVHSNDWVSKKGISKPRDIPENYYLKDQLYDYEKLIRETHLELQKKTPGVMVPAELLKKAVYAKKLTAEVADIVSVKKEQRVLITDFFQTMIDDTESKKRLGENGKIITKGTISTYYATMKNFIKFQEKQKKKYYVTDFNQKLIDSFSDFVHVDLNMTFNSGGKNMKTFKVMMNYARKKKLISHEVILDNKITVTKEASDNIYLTDGEIEKMMALKHFEMPIYEVVRDYFVIGSKTGLRYSDYSMLSKARIDYGYITITTHKTLDKLTIPIHPLVKQIMEKYDYKLPKCPSNQVFNRYLKEIGKMMPELHQPFEKTVTRGRKTEHEVTPRYLSLGTHSSRRSFCTNEYLNGTPTITIMAISGHKTEKAFMTYIKANALQHAMLMKSGWDKRQKDSEEQAA